MNQALRVAIADDEPLMRRWYENALDKMGHELVLAAANGVELKDGCAETEPDLVITDIKMPGGDGLTAIAEIQRRSPTPVILVSAHHTHEHIHEALNNQVLAYLVKPIKQPDLQTAISLAMRRFVEFQSLQQQADSLSEALENRKLIERAKGVLMQRGRLDEPTAFRRLQRLSQLRNQKIVDVARSILDAEEAFVLGPD